MGRWSGCELMADNGDLSEFVQPEGATVAAFEQVVGKPVGMHVNFNVLVGVAGWAGHRGLLQIFIEYNQMKKIPQEVIIDISHVKQ